MKTLPDLPTLEREMARALTDLLRHRWAVVRQALDQPAAATLAQAAPGRWEPAESPAESSVTYSSMQTGSPIIDCADPVRELASLLLDRTMASTSHTVEVPAFNEATWNKYAPGKGHIGLHRDPPGVGGIIAVFTLSGQAVFTIQDQAELEVATGDLVLLAGNAWPQADDQCLRHGASKPLHHERTILTFRHNRGGAGAAYF